MKSLIFSGFFICQKSSYKQLDTVVHHIFLPYFYRGTIKGFFRDVTGTHLFTCVDSRLRGLTKKRRNKAK